VGLHKVSACCDVVVYGVCFIVIFVSALVFLDGVLNTFLCFFNDAIPQSCVFVLLH
jgi:hypothetical protein